MARQVAVTVHSIAEDGLPDMDALVGRVAFVFDRCIVSGWPIGDGPLWEADTDVGHARPMSGVTHWVEFPQPIWEMEQIPDRWCGDYPAPCNCDDPVTHDGATDPGPPRSAATAQSIVGPAD